MSTGGRLWSKPRLGRGRPVPIGLERGTPVPENHRYSCINVGASSWWADAAPVSGAGGARVADCPSGPTQQELTARPNRHQCPDTPSVTDVLIQNCHRCPETSHPRGPGRRLPNWANFHVLWTGDAAHTRNLGARTGRGHEFITGRVSHLVVPLSWCDAQRRRCSLSSETVAPGANRPIVGHRSPTRGHRVRKGNNVAPQIWCFPSPHSRSPSRPCPGSHRRGCVRSRRDVCVRGDG